MKSILCLLVTALVLCGSCVRADHGSKVLDVPFIRQPNGYTCMPSSLLMALGYFEKDTVSADRIKILHRDIRCNRLNVPAVIETYGMHGDASYSPYWTFEDIKEDIDAGLPVVLGTDYTDAGHIILAVGYTKDGKVIVHDPGFQKKGYVEKTLEELKFDGGGIRFHKVPVGPWQGEYVKHDGIGWISESKKEPVWFEYRNRGTQTWSEGQVQLRPSGLEQDEGSVFYDEETWDSPTCIAAIDRDVMLGETYRFEFTVNAPEVGVPTSIYQPFHLYRVAGNEPFSYPRDQDIGIDCRVWPCFELPLQDSFLAQGAELPWVPKWNPPAVIERDDDPMGDGYVLRVQDVKEGGFESARIGSLEAGDYKVTALLYCAYRPDAEKDGFERIGVFARDRYRGNFEQKNLGNCYLMTYDTNNGQIFTGKCIRGKMADFAESPVRIKESGWHEFAIDCRGETITYFLDGKQILQVEDDSRSNGQAGIGHHEYYEDNSKAEGALAAYFKLEQ